MTSIDSADAAPASLTSIDRLHYVTSAVLGYAVKAGWVSSNPAAGVKLPASQKAEQIYLNFEEVESLADAAEAAGTQSDRALVLLLAYSGLRINEALALTVADVDITTRRVSVRRTWTIDAAGARKLGMPKTGERRVVPLVSFIVEELKPLLDGRTDDEYVFRAQSGQAVHDHNWRPRVWAKAVAGRASTRWV
ncbi:hypothetical protein GCM10017602_16690 [Herbiconiux flava]|nr:hypothetical protein GCM10017602_16690 [Herbiconiux flava]